MKRIQKTLLICLTVTAVYLISFENAAAQSGKILSKCYFQAGTGAGNFHHNYSDINLQAVLKNKWSLSLSCQVLDMMRRNNIPADYIPAIGKGEFLSTPYSYTYPYTYPYAADVDDRSMQLFSLTGGKYIKLGRNTWATTEAGASLVKGNKVEFTAAPVREETVTTLFGWEDHTTSNYETTVRNKTTVGAMLKADINWAFASFMGIGTGVYGNLNSIQSPVGFQVNLLVGYMGREKKHKR